MSTTERHPQSDRETDGKAPLHEKREVRLNGPRLFGAVYLIATCRPLFRFTTSISWRTSATSSRCLLIGQVDPLNEIGPPGGDLDQRVTERPRRPADVDDERVDCAGQRYHNPACGV